MSSHKAKSKVLDDSEDDDLSNESFVVYGTELPDVTALGEKDKGKFQPVWKQEVRDEQGLRRFHGAFKGGWSAGYFNTVGSKEGWAPSSFVSSRKNRTERQVFKPEDFMDEEDLEEFGQKQLVATKEFDSIVEGNVLGALPDKFIDDLVLPSKEPVGIRLLKAMGWREGQGIGPRVKRKKKDNDVFEDIDNEDNDDQMPNALFAPKNTSIVSFEQKSNNYGLGFNPFENAPEFVVQSSISKGTSMSDFHTSLMDEDDEDTIMMGNRKYTKVSNLSTESSMKKSLFSDNKLCHDGTQPLRGFMLARKPLPIDKWFSPPDLPPGYVPVHEFETDNQYIQDANKKNIKQKQTTLAIVAEQRGALLGESPLNAPARSVFDYVSRKDKERLDSIIRPVIDTLGDKNINKPPEVKIPKIEKDVALAALKGFIPFEDNKKKQARYKKYLEIHAELIAPELLKQPEDLTVDEFSKELDEFSQAARIFRPMSKMIASRFVTSTKPADEFKQPTPGLRAGAGDNSNITPIKQKDTNQVSDESTAEAAARMNMFGPLTRTKSMFYPNRLLCKRFNVANPHPDHVQNSTSGKTQKGQKAALSKETMDEILNKKDAQNFPGTSTTVSSSINSQSSVSGTSREEPEPALAEPSQPDDTKEADKKPYTRPAMELFKSIFGDSSSEDDDDAPKHKKPPNLVIGDSEPQDTIKDKSPIPISHNVDEEVSATPFRPMFKKKSDRGGDVSSAEIVKTKSESSSSKSKNQMMKGSLSFDDESFIGPSMKEYTDYMKDMQYDTKSKHDDDKSSVSSEESDSYKNSSRSSHKHSRKKHKTEKKKKKHQETSSSRKKKKRSYKRDLINRPTIQSIAAQAGSQSINRTKNRPRASDLW
ncbi:10696_t:CDS:10 [Cetraspora pellucida]|uniref:10696_t:CDS:1 n=1 Tax=Cetraspora pellucida TaxID=1433469 RepID=A0A9N9AC69_9GLOM|nr:10696_t:CDS:10 [Cetraspora pellucida]